MSRNRGRDTKPEIRLRKACWAIGMRYTLNAKLLGRPDFIFPVKKVAVFVDGCFWHGCPEHYQAPITRADFWRTKIEKNRARDRHVTDELRAQGWTVVRIWEHVVRSDLPNAVSLVKSALS